jgi:septal ring factor EnvC (AmiA/AmiB activator)
VKVNIAVITVGISIATFLLGIIYKLGDLSMKFGRMAKTIEANDERDAEERRRNSAKFSEIYSDRNRHEAAIARLDTTITNIDTKLEKVDAKLDRNEQCVTRLEAVMQSVAETVKKVETRLDGSGSR